MRRVATILRHVLEVWTVFLLISLAVVVVSAVVARYVFNSSFPWYDEVASVMLAWITYYGAALAALRRSHLGFSGLVLNFGKRGRAAAFVFSECVVYAVFITMAYASWYVLRIMAGETLVSLEWVPLKLTQSVVPIGCVLIVIAQALSTPQAWHRLMAGRDAEADEIDEEITKAQAELSRAREDGVK